MAPARLSRRNTERSCQSADQLAAGAGGGSGKWQGSHHHSSPPLTHACASVCCQSQAPGLQTSSGGQAPVPRQGARGAVLRRLPRPAPQHATAHGLDGSAAQGKAHSPRHKAPGSAPPAAPSLTRPAARPIQDAWPTRAPMQVQEQGRVVETAPAGWARLASGRHIPPAACACVRSPAARCAASITHQQMCRLGTCSQTSGRCECAECRLACSLRRTRGGGNAAAAAHGRLC